MPVPVGAARILLAALVGVGTVSWRAAGAAGVSPAAARPAPKKPVGLPDGAREPLPRSRPATKKLPKAPPKPPRTVALRYRFHEGDAVSYRVFLQGKGTATSAGAPGSVGAAVPVALDVEMAVAHHIARVRETGAAEIETSVVYKRTQINSMDFLGVSPSSPKVRAVTAPSGRVLELSGPKGGGPTAALGLDAGSLANVTQRLAFPDHPVHVGESWSLDGPPGVGDQYQAITTLSGLVMEAGREVARLRQVFAMPIRVTAPGPGDASVEISGRQAGDLVIRFDTAAGKVLGATGSIDSLVSLGQGGSGGELRLRVEMRMDASREKP